MEYENAHFLATLDRNIYDAFDEEQIVGLIHRVREYAKTLSNRQRDPAVAGIFNKRIGEYYFSTNDSKGIVPKLADQLKDYFDNMPDDILRSYIRETKGAGSHAEILALNEALKADPLASIDDFLIYVMHGGQKLYEISFERCPHCQWITQLFYSIYK